MEQTQYSGKIAVSGKLEATYNRNVVQITSSTMGALIKTESDSFGNTIYCIAFEDDDNKYLRFLQPANSMEERMYLIYDFPQSQSVNYGGSIYKVTTKGTDALKGSRKHAVMDNKVSKLIGNLRGVKSDETDSPYLLVKMSLKIKENEKYRKAAGRKVQVN